MILTGKFYYLLAFVGYALILVGITIFASRKNRHVDDFKLGGRDTNGMTTALGAGASDMSSWLLMALPGAVFSTGLSMIWLPLALVLGSYLNWTIVAAKLRVLTEKNQNSMTLPSFFAIRYNAKNNQVKIITSVILLFFFTMYAVAGFISGAKLLTMLFEISHISALTLMMLLVVFYKPLRTRPILANVLRMPFLILL